MSTTGRVIGHGVGILFMGLGALFLVLGFSDAFTNWLNENSSCAGGSCPENGARTTFLMLGFSFFAGGLITSVATEFAIRKTQRLMGRVTTFAGSPEHSAATISEFLGDFGIDVDLAKVQAANVTHRTIDLRGQRHGEVPTNPAGLSAYLRERGVTIDESLLRDATVVDPGTDPSRLSAPGRGESSTVAEPARNSESVRETATIVRKRDRGATSGNQRLVEFELEVRPAGRVPYRVDVASLVRESLAGLLIEGSSLVVRVNPLDSNAVTIDWSEN